MTGDHVIPLQNTFHDEAFHTSLIEDHMSSIRMREPSSQHMYCTGAERNIVRNTISFSSVYYYRHEPLCGRQPHQGQ